ncbi:hypothetical protein [Qipengyuania sp. 902]|uniref:hypothetical protein n=1 Tax=Qipengyuania sp. 902 TaxID=3417565 RepID=UPI003EBD3702
MDSGKCLFLREQGIPARGTKLSARCGVTFHILSVNIGQSDIEPRNPKGLTPQSTVRAPIRPLGIALLPKIASRLFGDTVVRNAGPGLRAILLRLAENMSGVDEANV